jgi:hypothetical protein
MVCGGPLFFVTWIRGYVQLLVMDRFPWPLALPVVMVVGHQLTRNTPLSTGAGIERRKQRVERNTTGHPDRLWLVVTTLFFALATLQLATVFLVRRRSDLRSITLNQLHWSIAIIQTAVPLSLALGAWHRTRWGWKPERFAAAQEPGPPLVGRTAADVGFKICIGLLVIIFAATAIQFVKGGTNPNQLFRWSNRSALG